jgi:hypothetical protein
MQQAPPDSQEPPRGKVLFSRDGDAAAQTPPASADAAPSSADASAAHSSADAHLADEHGGDADQVTDAEREVITFTAYDLDVHLTPASAAIAVRAGLTLRNDGAVPVRRLALDISSSLRWDAISSLAAAAAAGGGADSVSRAAAAAPLKFSVTTLDTDADHTGQMNEAVVTLPQALAPGASLAIAALYSGAIPQSAGRLLRIGAPQTKALDSDWDEVGPSRPDSPGDGTALRGFGNVIWYPVSASPVFLGDGAKLFEAVGRAKLRESAATVRLRLAVEYAGDPPDAAFFCGRREPLLAISDNADAPAAEAPGIATAMFDARALGFRIPSLFVAGHAPSRAGTAADPDLIAAVTGREEVRAGYSAAAEQVAPMLTEWFGAQPLGPLTILDHPGQPYEDGTLLVGPMTAADPAGLATSLAHSLTHAWIHSSRAWIEEGLAEFAGLLWVERTQGRAAALAQMQEAERSLALVEPETPAGVGAAGLGAGGLDPRVASSSMPPGDEAGAQLGGGGSSGEAGSPAGESLAAATGEVFYRTKAAAVWWMLRAMVGDEALQQALQAYRRDAKLDRDPDGFERTLETVAHADLRWFFQDWVYRDRGLPDLRIVGVTPSQLASHGGVSAGWLVAVEIRNDGYAEAEVPVTVRSATARETVRVRVAGQSSASTRIVFAGTPEAVDVNDGTVPETEGGLHTRRLEVATK